VNATVAADLPFSPAADRNKAPILAALQRLLPASARVLEIASGTGQHAQHFASVCSRWVWQPTDADATMLPAINARCDGLTNVLPALRLDVAQTPWPLMPQQVDAVYCANLLHISPWPACAALMTGAATQLVAGGCLLLYGPYRQHGVPTAPGNEAFDADLKSRNAEWGLRSVSSVQRAAAAVGSALREVLVMPSNNLLLVFNAGSA
jgi:SAM-dependent methyltransferase